jgi:hypothetical protein
MEIEIRAATVQAVHKMQTYLKSIDQPIMSIQLGMCAARLYLFAPARYLLLPGVQIGFCGSAARLSSALCRRTTAL